MRLIILFLIAAALTSCKAPLPVYFDKPIGVLIDSFPETIQGDYYPLDDIVNKGLEKLEETYNLEGGKIVRKKSDSAFVNPEIAKVETRDTLSENIASVDTVKKINEENPFRNIASLNPLSIYFVDSSLNLIDKNLKIVFSFFKITKDKISIVYCDSSAENKEVMLFRLNENIRLSAYSDDFYLNIKTQFGWEYIKIEMWNKGKYLNIVPFYFTSYDDTTGDVKTFLRSTSEIYPNLKPVYNDSHIIVGVKGVSKAKVVKEKFKNSENNFELLKMK